jgi:hypothetical protein
MRLFRLKKKFKKEDKTSVYCLQERKFFVWVTIEEIADKEQAKRAIAETREGAFYSWLLKSPK